MKEWTLAELAGLVGGDLTGDPGVTVIGLASLETATARELAFVATARHQEAAVRSRAGCFVVGPEVALADRPRIRVAQPYLAVATLLEVFHPASQPAPGVHPTAVVAPSARVAADASLGAFVVVGEDSVIEPWAVLHPHVVVGKRCRVGEASVLHPHVVLREDVLIGCRVIVHAGTVLGADGFGYVFHEGRHRKIPQVGRVVVEDDVELGANVTVDRATLGETRIGRGTKIDNLVQIGHNTTIGTHAIVVAQTGISGSCRVGHGVMLAGQVGIADHVTVGDGARVAAQTGVPGDVPAGATVFGTPAMDVAVARRVFAAMPRLPELLKRVRHLERRLAALGGAPESSE